MKLIRIFSLMLAALVAPWMIASASSDIEQAYKAEKAKIEKKDKATKTKKETKEVKKKAPKTPKTKIQGYDMRAMQALLSCASEVS